jgi:hypothetical protein
MNGRVSENVMSESSGRAKPLLAMIALETASIPPAETLLDTLQAVTGLTVDRASVQAKENGLVFSVGKDMAAIALVPAPIPWSNLEGPCATAWWWPAATERMKGHTSHLLVALGGDTGPLVLRYLMLTHLTAAAAAQSDAVGIFWLAGALVHDPPVFVEQVQSLAADRLPLHLWIDFRIEPVDPGRHRLFTTGMRAFRQEEIEIPPSDRAPADMLELADAVAQYILRTNPEIGQENTVGRSEDEKVRAVYAPSMLDPTITVLRLEF